MPAWRSAAAREGITYTSATPGAHTAIAQQGGGGAGSAKNGHDRGGTRGAGAPAARGLGRSGTMRAFSWKAERATAVPGGTTRRSTWTHKWFHKRVLSEPLDAHHPIVTTADMLVVAGLLFTATFTTFQVGYLVGLPEHTVGGFWYASNRVVDVIFLIDILVQFRTRPINSASLSVRHRRRQVSHGGEHAPAQRRLLGRAIALRYLRTSFPIDLVALLAGLADWLLSGFSQSSGAVNLLRLCKLLRLAKAHWLYGRLKRRYASIFAIDYNRLALLECFASYVLSAHLLACVLGIIAVHGTVRGASWLVFMGYCQREAATGLKAALNTTTLDASWVLFDERGGVQVGAAMVSDAAAAHGVLDDALAADADAMVTACAGPRETYLGTFLWSVQVISGTAGFPPDAGVSTPAEQVVFSLAVMWGCLLVSNIIGTFASVLSNLDPEGNAFKQRMDSLNRFARQHDLEPHVRRHLRSYMLETRHLQVAQANADLVALLSPQLQSQVALLTNHHWLKRVPFLRGVERECWIQLAVRMVAMVLMPGELAPGGRLYVIQRGTIVHRTTILMSGQLWGTDVILNKFELRKWSGRALTVSEVHYIGRDELMALVDAFPIAESKVRWSAIRMALVRTLQAAAADRDRASSAPGRDDGGDGNGGAKESSRSARRRRTSAKRGGARLTLIDGLSSSTEVASDRQYDQKSLASRAESDKSTEVLSAIGSLAEEVRRLAERVDAVAPAPPPLGARATATATPRRQVEDEPPPSPVAQAGDDDETTARSPSPPSDVSLAQARRARRQQRRMTQRGGSTSCSTDGLATSSGSTHEGADTSERSQYV